MYYSTLITENQEGISSLPVRIPPGRICSYVNSESDVPSPSYLVSTPPFFSFLSFATDTLEKRSPNARQELNRCRDGNAEQ